MANPESDDERLRKLRANLEQELDQNLAEVRDEYLSFLKAEKHQFRAWVSKIVEVEEPDEILSEIKI